MKKNMTWLNRLTAPLFPACHLFTCGVLLQTAVFAVNGPPSGAAYDTLSSGRAWSLWNDGHDNVWAARALPLSAGRFEDGTIKPYWSFQPTSTIGGVFQAEYRRTRHFEWFISHHGIIQFRKIGSETSWRKLLNRKGERVSIDHFPDIDTSPDGLIVEQRSDPKRPFLLSISDSGNGEPKIKEFLTAPLTHSTIMHDNGLTDGTGGHGVLFFDRALNLLSLAPGNLFTQTVCSSAKVRLPLQFESHEKVVNGTRGLFDPQPPEILGYTKHGIVLRQKVLDDDDDRYNESNYYYIQTGRKATSLHISGAVLDYACDGRVLWAVVEAKHANGTNAWIEDDNASFNLMRFGDGPVVSVALPIVGTARHFHTLHVKLTDRTEEIFEVSPRISPNSTDVCLIVFQKGKEPICSPMTLLSGTPSVLGWHGTIQNDQLLVPMIDGSIRRLDMLHP